MKISDILKKLTKLIFSQIYPKSGIFWYIRTHFSILLAKKSSISILRNHVLYKLEDTYKDF